jgi:hypothetical protein
MTMANSDGRLEWTVLGFAAVVAVALTIKIAPSLGAAPSDSKAAAAPATASQAEMIDRSRKGDRAAPGISTAKIVLPQGCESQVSPMTKLAPGQFIARCLT